MTQLLPPCIAISAALLSSLTLANDNNAIYQSIQLGVTQQSQLFEFNDNNNTDTRINVWGTRAQYQVGKGPWNIIMDYHQADASDSEANNQHSYELDFETKSVGLFIEYYLEKFWFATGYSNSNDTTDYLFDNTDGPLPNNQKEHFSDYSEVKYQSITLESGYIHYTQSGQWAATWGLTQQEVEEDIRYNNLRNNTTPVSNSQINEEGVLTNLTVSYGHFLPISDTLQLALNAGLRREITIRGDGRIQQSTRQGSPAISEDLQSTSQSASTSQQAQASLQHSKGSISLSVDKLSDQSFPHSYFSAALSVYF